MSPPFLVQRRGDDLGDRPYQPPCDLWQGVKVSQDELVRAVARIHEARNSLLLAIGITSPRKHRSLLFSLALLTDLLQVDPGPRSPCPPPLDPGVCYAGEESCRLWNVPRGSMALPLRGGLCSWQMNALPWPNILISDFPFLN